MKKIIDFFKNSIVQRVLLLLGAFVLIILLVNSCNKNKEKEIKYNQNISYYTDSLRIERNKVNELEYTTNILSASNKNLEELNTDLSNELKKEKGTVVYLSKVVASLKDSLKINNKIPGGQINDQINQDNTQTIVFEHKETYSPGNEKYTSGSIDVGFCDDEYVSQSFISTNNDTIEVKIPVIDKNAVSVYLNDSIVMTMTTGLKENEKTGILEIFVRSNYPGFTVSYLDGAIIDPHKSTLIKSYFPNKKWGLGINFGIGGFVNHGQLYPGIGCIIGLNYNFVTWNFKNKR